MSRYLLKDEKLFVDRAGKDIIICDGDKGKIYALGEIESKIWDYIIQGNSLQQIIETMKREYSAEEEEIAQDVKEYIVQLIEAGILVEGE